MFVCIRIVRVMHNSESKNWLPSNLWVWIWIKLCYHNSNSVQIRKLNWNWKGILNLVLNRAQSFVWNPSWCWGQLPLMLFWGRCHFKLKPFLAWFHFGVVGAFWGWCQLRTILFLGWGHLEMTFWGWYLLRIMPLWGWGHFRVNVNWAQCLLGAEAACSWWSLGLMPFWLMSFWS